MSPRMTTSNFFEVLLVPRQAAAQVNARVGILLIELLLVLLDHAGDLDRRVAAEDLAQEAVLAADDALDDQHADLRLDDAHDELAAVVLRDRLARQRRQRHGQLLDADLLGRVLHLRLARAVLRGELHRRGRDDLVFILQRHRHGALGVAEALDAEVREREFQLPDVVDDQLQVVRDAGDADVEELSLLGHPAAERDREDGHAERARDLARVLAGSRNAVGEQDHRRRGRLPDARDGFLERVAERGRALIRLELRRRAAPPPSRCRR